MDGLNRTVSLSEADAVTIVTALSVLVSVSESIIAETNDYPPEVVNDSQRGKILLQSFCEKFGIECEH
jgi:hypothetical protein